MTYRFLVAVTLAIGTAFALLEWPYAYYGLLRLVVFGGCIYLAFSESQAPGRKALAVALGAAAVIFNPLLPIHLEREAWFIIDLIASGFFAFIAFGLLNRARIHPDPHDPLSRWFENRRTLKQAEAEIRAMAEAEAQQAFAQASAEASRKRYDRLKGFAVSCGANPDQLDSEGMASALSLAAVDKLLTMRDRASTSPPPSLLRDLLLLIATDAISQMLKVAWEPLFLALHAGENLRLATAEPEDTDFEEAAQRFHSTLDLQEWLHNQPMGVSNIQIVGKAILRWTLDQTEEPLYEAVGAIRQLEPSIRKFEKRSA